MRLCYSNLACPDWTFESSVEAVNTYGLDGLEIRLFDGDVVTPALSASSRRRGEHALRHGAVRVAALDTSLEVTSPDRERFLADVAVMAEIAEQWGAPLLRLFGGRLPPGPEPKRDQAMRRAADLLVAAEPVAWAHGVRLAVETHDDFSSARLLAEVLGYARGSAGAVYDVHHPHRMGERPEQVLQALGHNIRHVHVKDAVRLPGRDEWQLVPIGQGEVPVREVLGLLPAGGYDGWVSLEFERKWHPELERPEVALRPQIALLREWLRPG
jgi:sugar phosphate isomerase/epimerase